MKKTTALAIILIIESVISIAIISIGFNKKVELPKTRPEYKYGYNRSVPSYSIPVEYQDTIEQASSEHGVPVWLLARMINRESSWNKNQVTVNRGGSLDYGLVQLNSRYLADFRWRYFNGQIIDPYNPDHSITVAARMLKHFYRLTGSWVGSVAAYNCGLARWQSGDIPESTLRHVDAIFGGI